MKLALSTNNLDSRPESISGNRWQTAFAPAGEDRRPAHARETLEIPGNSTLTAGKALVLTVLWAALSTTAGFQLFGDSPDLINYYYFFINLNYNFSFADSRFEYGFQVWTWLAKFVFQANFAVFMLSIAATSLGIKFYLFWRYLSSPILAAIVYSLGFYLLHEYTQVRSAMGVSLALLGVHKALKGERRNAILFYLAAFLFHYSMVVIPLVAYAAVRLRGKLIIVSVIAAVLAGLAVLIGALIPFLNQFVINTFSALNPLTAQYVYNDSNVESANVFSVPSLATAAILIYMLSLNYVNRSNYHLVFILLGLASFVGLIIFRDSLELALRMRDALAVSMIFAVFRSRITVKEIPPMGILALSSMYLFYQYWTIEVVGKV